MILRIGLLIFVVFGLMVCTSYNKGYDEFAEIRPTLEEVSHREGNPLSVIEAGFDTLDRLAAIQNCANCHKQEYDNWLKGPHANAYKTLLNHLDYIQDEELFSESYRNLVPTKINNVCLECHAPQNLFETTFLGLDTEMNPKKYVKEEYPDLFKKVRYRNPLDIKNLSTGVDCLSCHQSGHNVVTENSDRKVSGMPCAPIKSNFFSSDMNCFSCHFFEVASFYEVKNSTKTFNQTSCVKCHQEYDQDGKGTHYFFWRNDDTEKERPKHLSIFNGYEVTTVTKNEKNYAVLSWQNNFMPHNFGCCGEALLSAKFVDEENNELATVQIRLNRISEMKDLNTPHFKEGTEGNLFPYNNETIIADEILPEGTKPFKVILKGYEKGQYWKTDKGLHLIHEKELLL